jgi:subtilisin family serine protease
MRAMRILVVLALAAGFGVFVSPARGDGLLPPGFPSVCLPPIGLPFLQCSPGSQSQNQAPSPPGKATRPAVVTSTKVRYDPRRIIVRFRRRTLRDAINAAFARANVRVERILGTIGLYVVKAPQGKRDGALASLRRERSVNHVEREVLLDAFDTIPNDPEWPDQWGLRTVGFPKAWDVTRGSKAVVVAVLDTGIDGSHPDLNGALVPGRDIVHNTSNPVDDNGHGTAVAGVIAARGDNGIGLAGACWACTVMPVKVLGQDGTGTTSDVAAGIIWAVDHGARVINLSLGAPGTTEALSEAIDYAANKDVVVVAAAGNSSSADPYYPAADVAVIGVAATNEQDQLYGWSNHGSWVQVAAPGCNDAPWPNGAYVSFCGTSAAAPLVAGLAALVRSARPTATAQDTVKAVYQAVDRVSPEVRRGRINAGTTVTGLGTSSAGTVHPMTTNTVQGSLNGRVRSRTVTRPMAAGELVAVLKFTSARRLSLLVYRAQRRMIVVSGKSPLRLKQNIAAGSISLVVKGGGARASYRLTLSYARP